MLSWKEIQSSYENYGNYLWREFTLQSEPWWKSYFVWLLAISVFFLLLEWVKPWRKNQPKFRKDFWLDAFYMFFNFFLFSLIIYNVASDVFVDLFKSFLALFGIKNLVAIQVDKLPIWGHLLIGFIVRDFVQWWTHRLLHRVNWLWQFHKVHHSVQQMGFAAHLRYHWMETVVYRTIEYIPLAMIGIGLNDFFIIHIFTLAVGHFNHSNYYLNLGWLKYVFNNPQMHIWHHAKELPNEKRFGVNFGLTLSIWDYLFKTDYIPYNGRDIELGFEDIKEFPDSFIEQSAYGIGGRK
ncbi:MAG: sterol desaturase/sphingolipid hydroxylase (fatty acid hydroxylase superfamily) [Arenicella sp.]|jgi:sterol desaturase/sphingolipid hydroxylase (fatty acid hydroxylase superfamily)